MSPALLVQVPGVGDSVDMWKMSWILLLKRISPPQKKLIIFFEVRNCNSSFLQKDPLSHNIFHERENMPISKPCWNTWDYISSRLWFISPDTGVPNNAFLILHVVFHRLIMAYDILISFTASNWSHPTVINTCVCHTTDGTKTRDSGRKTQWVDCL